ncbi:probable E3 ubiquitin-protein ligase HECTD2 [Oppia nitens]|uniref:probable E3 ubiquitin-protein ligase HECTD2 n=1 Tax=Oppia nitens TaxID=1686743 RepID=UPI0023DCA556|nr:probable E3 ubiquitin-protein ligase HECTD2 [Oppia nitens]
MDSTFNFDQTYNEFNVTNLSTIQHLTCPSCHITLTNSRHRSMCPFCGSFYNPNVELDIGLRSDSRILRPNSHQNILHLPPIDSRQHLLRVTGFGPLITDGLGVIHTYITGLLFPPHIDDESSNLLISLPPINNSHSDLAINDNINDNQFMTNSSKTQKLLNQSLESSQFSYSNKYLSTPFHYPKRDFTLNDFKNLLTISCESADYTQLHDFYEQTFSSNIELNALFKVNANQSDAKSHDPEINIIFLYTVYDELNNLPSFISKTVLKGVIASLSSTEPLKSKDEIRAIFMLLQNPIFSNQSSYNVFAHLLKRVVNLNSGDHQLLINWFSKLQSDKLKALVKNVLQFITIREFPPNNGHKLPTINKSKFWIPCATRVLALLNAANNKMNPNVVNYTEFYNYALDHINLMSEYYRWQNPSKVNRFSYCQYPFILSIVAKKTILQRDSEQQMILNARQSLLNRAIHQQMADIDVFFLNLNIRRSNLVIDSLNEIAKKQSDLKKKLKVTFIGEPGLDMGGLTKEWFLLLIKQIFHQDYGMFVYHKKSRCYWFSTVQNGNLREYNLIGVLMGLAVYNSIILDLHFPTLCFKKLLSPPVVPLDIDRSPVGMCNVTMDDFTQVIPDVAIGLKELLAYEGNVEEDFCMNFQVSVEEFGEVRTHILKPNGHNIIVNNDNRFEFVKLYMDLILNKAIFQAFKAFYLGFHSVCASNALIMLRPEEVEVLVCGCPTIDMEELRKATVYEGYLENEPIIRYFWDTVKSFSIDMQKDFLRFVTGSDRVPINGMSDMNFKISALNSNTDMLPISHTCFNQLVLPRYSTQELLREKLIVAINNAEGFGLE